MSWTNSNIRQTLFQQWYLHFVSVSELDGTVKTLGSFELQNSRGRSNLYCCFLSHHWFIIHKKLCPLGHDIYFLQQSL